MRKIKLKFVTCLFQRFSVFFFFFFSGVLLDVENMTIQDGGSLIVYEMVDLNGRYIDEIKFGFINIRTGGTFIAKNGRNERLLNGTKLQVIISNYSLCVCMSRFLYYE